MQLIRYPDPLDWDKYLQRPVQSIEKIEEQVVPIMEEVRRYGDAALLAFAKKFDKAEIDSIRVTSAEIEAAAANISPALKTAIDLAKANIERFHQAQLEGIEKIETMPGVICWRKSVAIEKVGLYIPGGTAPLFSTVLMLAIPAKIAGCREIVLCTPPNPVGSIHPAILYAAGLCGITTIIKAGGAQAIAAMAFGTTSVPKADKIFGPGNQYVTAAKQLVQKTGIAIDMPAGPSEVLVVADDSANADFVAADLLSQAEHGPDSQVILVTTHDPLVDAVKSSIQKLLAILPRNDTAQIALSNSRIFLVKDLDEAMALSNAYAPEHLILATGNAGELAEKVVNAGSVFIGNFSPEAAGDYASGTNHTLPTNGYARAYSGVSVDSFVRKITFQQISEEGLKNIGPCVSVMADAESLEAHRQAIEIRLKAIG